MIRYKVGDANLNIKIAKEEFPDLLRMLSANVDDLEATRLTTKILQLSRMAIAKQPLKKISLLLEYVISFRNVARAC